MHLRLISNYDTKRSTDQSFQEFASLIVLEKYSRSTALSFKKKKQLYITRRSEHYHHRNNVRR